MEGERRGHGGGKVRERQCSGIDEGPLRCVILAHYPLLAFIVNLKSLPQVALFVLPFHRTRRHPCCPWTLDFRLWTLDFLSCPRNHSRIQDLLHWSGQQHPE